MPAWTARWGATMGEEPRCTLVVEAVGEDYDSLVRDARSKAVAFLGPERAYWISIEGVGPAVESPDGTIKAWRGDARITYPHEPAF